jgi:hypothetical protein
MRSHVIPDGSPLNVQVGYAEVIAIHAALLHTGQILYFGGDEHDPGRHHLGMVDTVRLFDCSSLTVTTPPATTGISDFFCCGHAFLGSGHLLVGGGTEEWSTEQAAAGDPHGHEALGHFRGLRDCWTFDPLTSTWTRVADMLPQPGQAAGGGRWYPTLLTLGDGRVVALSGHPSNADSLHFNYLVEVFSESGGGWWEAVSQLPNATTYYPRCHLLPDGSVFFATPIGGNSYRWQAYTNSWTPVCPTPGPAYEGIATSTVLLPLTPANGYRPRVLTCGDSGPMVIDLGSGMPSWQHTGPRTLIDPGPSPSSPKRTNLNAVLLPTGEVAVVGGMRDTQNDPGSAVHEIELYRPETDSWVTLPAAANAAVPRSYHSTALLMPDGRVWMAGSNMKCSWSFHDPSAYPSPSLPTSAQDDAIDHRDLRIELFEPWYFGRPDRPTFTLPHTGASWGGQFKIDSPEAATISRVVLVRCGSSTHAFDPDQRLVEVTHSLLGPAQMTASIPANHNLLPPGYYLLFILNQVVDPNSGAVLDVPSLGQFIHLGGHAKFIKEFKPEVDLKSIFDKLPDKVPYEKNPFEKPVGEKLPKEVAEGPTLEGPVVDPVIRALAERLDNLESRLAEARTFIGKELRPSVGTQAVARSYAFANQSAPVDPMLQPAEAQRTVGMEGQGDGPPLQMPQPDDQPHGHA